MHAPLHNRLLRTVAQAAALLVLAGNVIAAGPDIARLAPERTFAVVSVPQWQQLRASFESSGLGALWKEPVIASLIEKVTKDEVKWFNDLLNSVRADAEDLKHPTGHLGAALFWPEPKNGEDQIEFDEPHFLLVAEFGEHADEWQLLVDKFVDRGLDDRIITLDDDNYRDVKITIIRPVYEEHRAGNGHDHGQDGDDGRFDLGDALGGSIDDPRNLHLSRIGDAMLVSSSLDALELAIDRMNGEGRDALAESTHYRDALSQHDRGSLAYAVFLTGPIFAAMDDEEEFGTPSTKAMFDILGFTSVNALSASLRLDTTDSVVDLNISALAPEKKGALELLSESAGAFEPPAFIGPDAASALRLSFRFDKVLDFARAAARAMPPMVRGEIENMIEQASAMAGPALDAMGPIVHGVTTYRQPYSVESDQTTWIIDVNDELTVSNTLSFLAAQSGGMLETRDFEGTVLYSMEMPAEISVAVGLGRLFVGTTAGVENALRAAGRPDAPRLAEERSFQDAVRNLSTSATVYTYMNLEQYLRWTWWSYENADKILAETLDRVGVDEEYREEILRQSRENVPDWQKELPPVDVITRHLGDVVYELRSTASGYTGRILLLKTRE